MFVYVMDCIISDSLNDTDTLSESSSHMNFYNQIQTLCICIYRSQIAEMFGGIARIAENSQILFNTPQCM